MDEPSPDELRARIADLEARLRTLQDENDRLAEAQTDVVLLGVLADLVQRETDPDRILGAGLERMSVLKDLPLCMACVREADRLVARSVHVASGEASPEVVVLTPGPDVLGALESGAVPLSGAPECAAAGFGAGALPNGIVPRAVLLLPFASRPLGRGAFLLADDRSEARLVHSAAVLERAAEIVVARLDTVALLDALGAASADAERRVAEGTRAVEDRLQSEKMESIGRLAGGVAHDFNNLLTTVLGVSEMLLTALPEGDPAREDLATVREAGRRAAALTRQLLAFSRRQHLEVRPVQLEELLRAFAPMLARLIGEDVAVRLDLAAPLPPVLADPGQVEQVLLSLAANARDAMPGGGTLTFTLSAARVESGTVPRPGGYVRLEVADSGEGMAAEVASRVFEPFFTPRPGGRGAGLGLATVHGIVSQHGGAIAVRSAPGRGTTFDILLPATEPIPLEPPGKGPTRADQGRGETVLVVDDEPLVRRAIRRSLQSRGYAVIEAASGEEALRVLSAGGAVDLLLTDVVMPGMRGPELARAFQERCPGRPVLVMSGYPEAGGGETPTGGWLEKPITPEALARAVRDALDAATGRAII